MINRDSFDSIEVQIRDRYRFMQWALAAFTVAVTLAIDRGLDLHLEQNAEHAKIVLFFTVPFLIFGVVFLCLLRGKSKEYKTYKDKLFDKSNIIKDETVVTTADGSTFTIDHLEKNGEQDGEG